VQRDVNPQQLRDRTLTFGVAIVRLCRELRRNPDSRDIAGQLSASATSISANYRSASRARTKREFISKLCIALEEADETASWLELLIRSDTARGQVVDELLKEAKELVLILAASRRTAERTTK
jgi:four helix bundle protein